MSENFQVLRKVERWFKYPLSDSIFLMRGRILGVGKKQKPMLGATVEMSRGRGRAKMN